MFREFCTTCVGPLPNCCPCIALCPQHVIWISVSNRRRVGAAMILTPPWMIPRDGPTIVLQFSWIQVPDVTLEIFFADLDQDGPSHVRSSNRLFWQFDVLGRTTQMFDWCIQLQQSPSKIWSAAFSTFCLALRCCLSEETHIFTKLITFIRFVFDASRRTVSCTFNF